MCRDSEPADFRAPVSVLRGGLASLALVLLLTHGAPAGSASAPSVSHTVECVVLDRTGEPIEGASISVDGRSVGATGEDGRLSFGLATGEWELVATHPTHQTVRRRLTVAGPVAELELRMLPAMSITESVRVSAIRAGDDVPVTQKNLDEEQIEELSYGQDVPALLQYTPSLNWYSDSGIGANYSYLSIRGIGQTRINMTYDGAPLNDPAEHALYFNNFHDFTNEVGSIQIQRGVGTSTVGAPSFGGSVNFASKAFAETSQGEAEVVLGSYDTQRASLGYESGKLDHGVALSGRVSVAETDGYRDNSGTEHRTFFLNAGREGERSSLKLTSFSGSVESQLAYLAVDPATLSRNPRFNPLDPAETDDFGQDFAQLQYSHVLGRETLLSASVYYNGADGVFRAWDDPVAQNDLLEFGIDQYFVGSMVSATWTTDRLTATAGAHFNDFEGDHTLEVEGRRLYLNTGFKQTANLFGKAEYRLGDWLLYGDLQLRWAEFSYEGDVDLGSVDWRFADPRVGFRWFASPRLSTYVSLGRAQREPSRLDLLKGEDNATVQHDLEAVRPEEVVNLEAGFNLNTPRIGMQVNLYAMEFSNEIALAGELSEVGLPLRSNVEESYRRGLEVDLRWMVARDWTIVHSANLSRNRIEEWTQFYDVFDEQGNFLGSEAIVHRDVPPVLTPEAVINLGLEWTRGRSGVAVIGRHVAESHLDNTGNDAFVAPSYTNLDVRAFLDLGRWWRGARPRLTVYVNNVLDDLDQYPSGYSYLFLVQDAGGGRRIDGIPFYYPLAGRNVVAKLSFGF